MFNKGLTEKLVETQKEEFGLEVREFVNKTRFGENDGVKTVIGGVEEGFGSEIVWS